MAALPVWFVYARNMGSTVAWGIVVFTLVIGTAQAIYEYLAWQKEKGQSEHY
ncbi:MAG: hypothetical protein AAGG48_14960 [Planctomycetota bacterium]